MRKSLSFAVAVFLSAPLGLAGNEPAYPNDKVAEFVVKELDVMSLPSVFRPRKQKGKKTFAEYGFTARSVSESEAVIDEGSGGKRLAIRIIEQSSSGIYACIAEPGENSSETKIQTVLLVRRKNPNALLKSRESSREFATCPVIGETDSPADANGGD